MTKKPHPLTDDLAEGIAPNAQWSSDMGGVVFTYNDMRASADWQLKQVKERVAAKIAELRQRPGWNEDAWTLEFYFESILKDLRPQEED